MHDQHFESEHWVPQSRNAVFAFFSDPNNLESITPAWLRFRVVDQTTEHIEEGTEFTYNLRIRGLPVTWRSRIEEWLPNERFVDVQLQGPYAMWHHTHSFHDSGTGTLIRDRVLYRLPLGWLGRRFGVPFIAHDVKKIFECRAERTTDLLRTAADSAA